MSKLTEFSACLNAAIKNRKTYVLVPYTNINKAISEILCNNGFLFGFSIIRNKESPVQRLKLTLAYWDDRAVLKQFILISLPSRRVYTSYTSMVKFFNKKYQINSQKLSSFTPQTAVYIFSSRFGITTHYELLRRKQGGQAIAYCEV